MRTCDALKQFDQHQAGLLERLDGSRDLLNKEPSLAQFELARGRWEMIRKLRAYQIFKHTEIFDPAIASGSPAQRAEAAMLKRNCIAAGEDFLAYATKWSACDVTREWDMYLPAMRKMADDVRKHLAREKQQVTALLSGSEHTRRLSERIALSN